MNHCRIATIIPFYQKKSGILRKALMGVLAQDLPQGVSVHVFVIDDSSPLPPDADLADLPMRDAVTLSVHRQANAGPGGARNHGLDLAQASGFDMIAFLDSDDIWQPPHLSDALQALDMGYDIYCCDNTRTGVHDSYNDDVVPVLANKGAALLPLATELLADGPVLGFGAGVLAEEMVKTCLFHTSAIVATSATLHNKRFDADQRTAGEDHLLWIAMALAGARIALSWRTHVICGQGVNVFFSAFDWNEPATLERVGYQLLLSEKLLLLPSAMIAAAPVLQKSRENHRRAYSYLFVRTLLRGRWPGTESLRKIRRFDPLLPLRMPMLFAAVALDRRPDARRW